MKYLVNESTKEHRIYNGKLPVYEHGSPWRIVEADDKGWIKWNGGVISPLPDGIECEIKTFIDRKYEPRLAQDNNWGNTRCYRPILAERVEQAPTVSAPADVFQRLRAASAHAASIPAIISEIDALLGPDYQVVRVESVQAVLPVEPAEDMSDWRNWKAGDQLAVAMTSDRDRVRGILAGDVVTLTEIGTIVPWDERKNGLRSVFHANQLRFHSRPAVQP